MTASKIDAGERRIREWTWFIIAVGIVLRFQGLDWDRGFMFNPDEGNIGRAAALLSFPDRLVSDFSAYNGLALYLPRLLAELIAPLTGRAGDSASGIILAARLLSALFASLALPLVWSIARRLWRPAVALFVTLCAAATPALIQSAHFGTTESALILCLLATAWLTLRHMSGELGLTRYALSIGVAIGVGFGFKTTALAYAIVPIVAVLATTLSKRRVWPAIRAGALSLAIVAVIGLVATPQIWAATGQYLATMRFEAGVVAGTESVYWTYQFDGAPAGLFELAQLPWLIGPLLPPLGLAGFILICVALLRRRREAQLLAPLFVFSLVYAAIIVGWHARFVRYEFLLLPGLILFAGYIVAEVADHKVARTIMIAVGGVTAIAGLMQALIYLNPDPRIAAWDWLSPQLQAGDELIIEPVDVGSAYWYTNTPVQMSFLPLIEPPSPEKSAAIAAELGSGDWLIIASRRHHAVLPMQRQRFPEMCGYYDALWSGRLGYDLVARFVRRPLLNWDLSPELWAEETFTVFDSPEVLVLRNVQHNTEAEILAQMAAPSMICASGALPTPLR